MLTPGSSLWWLFNATGVDGARRAGHLLRRCWEDEVPEGTTSPRDWEAKVLGLEGTTRRSFHPAVQLEAQMVRNQHRLKDWERRRRSHRVRS